MMTGTPSRRAVLLGLPGMFLTAGSAAADGRDHGLVGHANSIGERLVGSAQAIGAGVAVSPLSLIDALLPLAAGARGETLDALATLLGRRPWTKALQLHHSLGGLEGLQRATAVWLPLPTAPAAAYTEALAKWGTHIDAVDFLAAETPPRINSWIAANTSNRIVHLVDRMPRNGGLVITAALHFSADWPQPFDPAETKPVTFVRADGRQATVPFIRGIRTAPYAQTREWQAVRLPYRNDAYELAILLPAPGRPATQVIQAARSQHALSVLARLRFAPAEIAMAIPKLSLACTSEPLAMLQRTAMAPAFGPGADYRGITGEPLRVGALRQRVVLRLDEAGTEATAATAVLGDRGLAERVQFTADRPFLALVIHRASGLHILSALITDPGAANATA